MTSTISHRVLDVEEIVAKVFNIHLLAGNDRSRNTDVQNIVALKKLDKKYEKGLQKLFTPHILMKQHDGAF